MRLKKNEEDFARLNSINFEDDVKDVKKKMPGENNPWSGELKARRKKSRTADLSSKEDEESQQEKLGGEASAIQETESKEHTNNGAPVNDNSQGMGDEDSDILKITRRNLKPVLQPFKRSESITDDVQTETPVDRLIRQGSLDATSEQPKARLSTNTRTMEDLSEKNDELQVREAEKLRKKSEEYLMVNFPANVRKNLKGIILPEKETETEREQHESENVNTEEKVMIAASDAEGNCSLGRARCCITITSIAQT